MGLSIKAFALALPELRKRGFLAPTQLPENSTFKLSSGGDVTAIARLRPHSMRMTLQPFCNRGWARSSVGSVKIPCYVVKKRRGYWQPKRSMQAHGFLPVRCGPDGPTAWARAEELNRARRRYRPRDGASDRRGASRPDRGRTLAAGGAARDRSPSRRAADRLSGRAAIATLARR